MVRNRLARVVWLVGAVGCLSSAAWAVDLINTSFEAGEYSLGTLTGQNGWIAFRDANPTAAQVSTAAALDGSQGVKIDGALMDVYPTGLYRGYYYPPINYDLTGTGNHIIEYSCDAALFISPADEFLNVAWQTQFYTGTDPYDPYGGIGLEAIGDGTVYVYAFNFSGSFEFIDYTPGTWVNLVARLNFDDATLTLLVDGVELPSVPMDTTEPLFGDADLTMICDVPFTSYTYVDNYRIVARGAADPCPCPGDFNGDNAVGLSDLTLFLASFGGAPSNPCMDSNNDGAIGLSDLTAFLSTFGSTCP